MIARVVYLDMICCILTSMTITEPYDKVHDVFRKTGSSSTCGYVHKHAGESEQARKDFNRSIGARSEVVTAYVNRGYMLNDCMNPRWHGRL